MTGRAPVVVRRASGAPRDVRTVTDLLTAAGLPPGDTLAVALSDDHGGAVLVAEQQGSPLGIAVIRWWGTPGGAPHTAHVDTVWVHPTHRRRGVARTLVATAVAEAEARGVGSVHAMVAPGDAAAEALARALGGHGQPGWTRWHHASPRAQTDAAAPGVITPGGAVTLRLAPGVTVTVDPTVEPMPAVTFWSGALAFRTRWRADTGSPSWTAEGCTSSRDEGSDVVQFDSATGTVRETWLARPPRIVIAPDLLGALSRAPVMPGAVMLPPGSPDFALPPTTVCLFDLDLGCLAAVTGEIDTEALQAVALSPEAAWLFQHGQYVGWRVLDPVVTVRPMGWPEPRRGVPPAGDRRTRLTALIYDWMTLDASPRPRPDEASDPEDIAHLVGLRDRARALAAETASDDDPTPDVARDIAATVHWSWGFFRTGE